MINEFVSLFAIIDNFVVGFFCMDVGCVLVVLLVLADGLTVRFVDKGDFNAAFNTFDEAVRIADKIMDKDMRDYEVNQINYLINKTKIEESGETCLHVGGCPPGEPLPYWGIVDRTSLPNPELLGNAAKARERLEEETELLAKRMKSQKKN